MRLRATVKLLVLVGLLGLAIWILDRQLDSTEGQRERATRVFDLEFDDMSYVRLEHGDLQAECIKDDGTWLIQWPLRGRADSGRLKRVLAFMEVLARSEVITSAQRRRRRLTLEDYGLKTPRARVVLRDRFDRREMLVGSAAPLGKLVYVMFKGRDEVIATSSLLLETLPASVNELRDRTIVEGDAARTARVAIDRPGGGFLQLTQTAGRWMIQQPVAGKADDRRVVEMLACLYSRRVAEFVWDAATGGQGSTELPEDINARFEPYGLGRDEAAARITVWVDRDEVGRELILGKAVTDRPDLVYARLRDVDSIFTVPKSVLDAFAVSHNDIRDRALFHLDPEQVRYASFEGGDRKLVLRRTAAGGWAITEPVQWAADAAKVRRLLAAIAAMRVEQFLDKEEAADAAAGLEAPACIVRLADTDAPPANTTGDGAAPDGIPVGAVCLKLGRPREERETIHAQIEGAPAIMEIRPGLLGTATFSLTDPYGFRDRTVLAFQPEHVNHLALVRDGEKQVVARDGVGAWHVVSPESGAAIADAIDGTLALAANVQALRVEPFDLKRREDYGLPQPSATLTFGLAGEDAIRKSLVIGARVADEGWYAVLQGQNIVFVLPDAAARRLMTDIVRMAEAEVMGE